MFRNSLLVPLMLFLLQSISFNLTSLANALDLPGLK